MFLDNFFASHEAEEAFYDKMVMAQLIISPFTFIMCLFVSPWGKTIQTMTGPTLPPRLGWCLFECPNLIWTSICLYDAYLQQKLATPNLLLLCLYAGHYVNRAIIYPLQLNPHTKRLPWEVVAVANMYTTFNGYIQARGLCEFTTYPEDYLRQPHVWVGVILFFLGVAINWQSDDILRNLRSKSSSSQQRSTEQSQSKDTNNDGAATKKKSHYVIPHGGFFRFVSAPHYMGEILEWIGFGIACQTWGAWSFVLFTAANLIPRGMAHHQWYRANFKDYPLERKAVIPFVL